MKELAILMFIITFLIFMGLLYCANAGCEHADHKTKFCESSGGMIVLDGNRQPVCIDKKALLNLGENHDH